MGLVVLSGLMASFASVATEISYQRDIQPIFDKKCVVCHACFDAPCQLILTHGEGASRGANKQLVYDGLRTGPAAPTRLFIDAQSTADWRKKGFFSVLNTKQSTVSPSHPGIMERLILLRQDRSYTPNSRLPSNVTFGLKRDNVCPAPGEMSAYVRSFPHGGMPYAVTGLTDTERQTLLGWLRQGAPMELPAVRLSAAEQATVSAWEEFFNRKGLRQQLLNRWLYEHLFMAHLYFSELPNRRFFQLVRSHTPPGKPIELIATRRPNDAPGKVFYYRLKPVTDTIVYKTHITFPLNKKLRQRIKQLFFDANWKVSHLPGYSARERANPFQTFKALPAEGRYRFMLEHAEYFVKTFIRGPVCHGQIASDVIRDQFWVFFQDPQRDLYISSPQYRKKTTPFMEIAGVEQDLLQGGKTWLQVKKRYNRYSQLREAAYARSHGQGAAVSDIWDGDGSNTNALLSVFRHYDNASVRRGLIGDYPLTVWWMDYPLFERGYYNLVANFDVFGSVAHQAQTRLYFDLIRNDAERNFLRLMPADRRRDMLNGWYEGTGKLKLMTSYQDVSEKTPTAIDYKTADPKRELLDSLLDKLAAVNARPDSLNRTGKPLLFPDRTPTNPAVVNALRRLTSRPARRLPAVTAFPEAALLRVHDNAGAYQIYTVMRNRMHSNVAFLFAEDLRRKPREDTLTIYPGILVSYPNFMFNVAAAEIDDFVRTVYQVKNKAQFEKSVIQRWGVRRTHPQFWTLFHSLTNYLQRYSPIEAGVMDMSRYQNL